MHNRSIAVVGLGYVGLPVAVAFSKKYKTVGFDISKQRIEQLKNGIDQTNEVHKDDLTSENLIFSSKLEDIAASDFYIIAVPTPIDTAKRPDLSTLGKASKLISEVIRSGDIVVFESTVYPGVTEKFCLPILEEYSSLRAGRDFFIAYSPERINPGDKQHTFTKIKKIVAAQTEESLSIVSKIYASVIDAGIYEASSIQVAEAAKVIENTQRDINIAFVNELSLIFEKIGLSTHEVLQAASTKWNFLHFKPGLVGGHCIGVDPYYLTYLAESIGYHPDVILSGRRINDRMGKHIAERAVKAMIKENIPLTKTSTAILGITFKENCPDVRNSKVIDIINELNTYNIHTVIHDPIASKKDVLNSLNIELSEFNAILEAKIVIIAVAHDVFSQPDIIKYLNSVDLIIDVKNFLKDTKLIKPKIVTI